MVPVLDDHFLDVSDGYVLPFPAAYMLPARYFGEYEQPYLVAAVYKGLGLG
jgi:hypothetical protein